MIEVILKREVPKLGERGEIVRVAQGYARNYLFPQQLAMPATAASKQQIAEMKAAADRESARLKGDAEKLAGLLKELTLKLVVRAGDSDQLFGSVTSRDLAGELEKQGYTIDRHKIDLNPPIRALGDHEVPVRLHRDVNLKLVVKVRAEGREDEEYIGTERQPTAAEVEAGAALAAEASEDQAPSGEDQAVEGEQSTEEESAATDDKED